MNIQSLMTENPACANPDTPIEEVAQMMVDCDCGMIPVLDSNGSGEPIGCITDRDIVIRCVAKGINPLDCAARDAMSEDPITISAQASSQEAEVLMANHQVRRLIVVDNSGQCIGVVAQADLALKEPEFETGQVIKEISRTFH